MTRKELPAQAANIKRAVETSTTCTPATVDSLKSYLMLAPAPLPPGKTILKGTRESRPKDSQAPAKPRPASTHEIRHEVTGLDGSQDKMSILQLQEKINLATEVANMTLKALTEAIKRPAPSEIDRRKSPSKSIISPSIANVLQPISANIASRIAEGDHRLRRSSSVVSTSYLQGLRSQAECAQVAFAALRSMHGRTIGKETASMQLESGMSALVSKLIALGFDDLAMKELRILKMRLDQSIGSLANTVQNRPQRSSDEKQPSTKGAVLAGLLQFQVPETSSPLLALIVTFQLQALKLITLKASFHGVEAAIKHLQLSVPYSPANLIERQIDSSNESRTKGARQLESLAQSIAALCLVRSASQDRQNSEPSRKLSPHIAFGIRALALEVRLRSWKLSGHQADIPKDLVEPFCRNLGSFRQLSTLPPKEKYELAKTAFQSLFTDPEQIITIPTYTKDPSRVNSILDIYQILADLAQECSSYEEAVEWLQCSMKLLSRTAASSPRLCASLCRIASVRLQTLIKGADDRGLLCSLIDAVESLERDIIGGPVELDDLLLAVVSLRRLAFNVIQDHQRSPDKNDFERASEILDACSKAIFLGVKFLIRFLGRGPGTGNDEKAVSRAEQRRRLVWNNAGSFFESIAAMARFSVASGMDDWERIDAGLQGCTKLATTLTDFEPHEPSGPTIHELKELNLVPLSNAYWYRYQSLRQKGGTSLQIRQALFLSIEILKNRSCAEKLAGLLPIKLERSGLVHEESKDFVKAAKLYGEALQLQVAGGILRLAAEAAASRPLSEVLGEKGDHNLLGRLLLAYPRVTLQVDAQTSDVEHVFDDGGLPASERGLLLEQQLAAVVSTLRAQSLSKNFCKTLQSLARNVLSVYSETEFPIRHLRVSIRLLRTYLTNSAVFDPQILQQISRSQADVLNPETLNSDVGLSSFGAHLLSSRVLCLNLRGANLDVQALEGSLASWSRMLRGCSNFASLQCHVDDISEWALQLESLAEYLDMHGLGLLRLPVLHILIMIQETMTQIDPSAVVSLYSALGSQYVRVGYSSQAGHALHKASKYTVESEIPGHVIIKWKLASTEYALGLGNVVKAEEHLAGAHDMFKRESEMKHGRLSTSKDPTRLAQLLADANYAYSMTAAAKGNLSEAFLFARQNLKLNYWAWEILKNRHGELNIWNCSEKSESENDTLANQLSALNLANSQTLPIYSTTSSTHQAAKFWSLIPRVFNSLVHLSQLYANEGLLQESQYYIKRAQKTADSVDALRLKVLSLALLGNYLTRSGKPEEGLGLLRQAEKASLGFQNDQYMALLYIFLAESHALQKNTDLEAHASDSAERTLEHLMKASFVERLNHQTKSESSLELKIDQLTLCEAIPARRHPTKQRLPSKAPVSKPADKTKAPSQETSCADALLLTHLKVTSLRQRAYAALRGNKSDLAASILSEATEIRSVPQDRILLAILRGHLYLRLAQENMAAHPVFCVLPESTVSHPSIANCRSRNETNMSDNGPKEKHGTSPLRKVQAKGSLRKPKQGQTSSIDIFFELLNQTQESLISVCNLAKTSCSTATIHTMTDVLTKTLMMLSAVTLSRPIVTASSTFAVYAMEFGRTVSSVRRNLPFRVSRQLSQRRAVYDWPTEIIVDDSEALTTISQFDFSLFQTQYIGIIPPSWAVLSISLSESQNEIRIARMRSDQTPFILNLPLNRHNSRDPGEEDLSFQNGKEELLEILGLANYSAHESKEMALRGASSEWWEIRRALDTRLKDLLVNIENFWFGGFRGIFSNCTPCPQLLSRFQQSLQNILDKHLPSRQKRERKKKSEHTFLDPRVLELFVGLGVPTELNDLDEPLMDLLYFVVDILQFHGERNAYDEIEFDAIVVEVIDALRQYHAAAKNEIHDIDNRHTILILDKALHAFPWESLPCMEGHPVSRLPSLQCLRDRIMQQDGNAPTYKGRHVHRSSVASVLNPSGDLVGTQKKLEQPLQSLPGWTTIMQRAPTEDEMRNCLENNEIFLYFGHGSGGQYISGRTVRNLEKCAVAVLMGCSSGALTEAREFEPYGTPMNFMQAGCPALVANLWDVTSGDVDLFSYATLEKWGLFSSDNHTTKRGQNGSPIKRAGRTRGGKGNKTAPDLDVDEGLSLDQAVAQARHSCRLRYLNGAAPVVYGVPVFLR